MKTYGLLTLFVILLAAVHANGQNPQQKKKIKVKKGMQVVLKDTVFITKSDTILILNAVDAKKVRIRENPYLKSTKFYDTLEEKSSANKLTKDIFELVVKKKKRKDQLVNNVIKSEEKFKLYAGKTIGSITIKSVDLLEGSVVDTLQKATTKVGILVNKLHHDTRPQIIRRNLLFEEGDVVDPYRLADNERILRQFKTLRDARIYLLPNKKSPDVVDVVVVTQDVASIGVSGDYSSPHKFRVDVYDVNILGYAKQLQLSYFRSSEDEPSNGYEITLREQNFRNTFIQAEIQYADNYIHQRTRVAFGRDFFTPEIKYAGGVELYRTHEKFFAEQYDTLEIPYTENYLDVWAGRSFEFRKRMNLIFSARVNTRNFVSRPFVSVDSNSYFHDRTLLLGSVSITKRNFLKSLRIRGFGKTEDIPIGGAVSVLLGKEGNEFIDRPYFEVNGTFGKYFSKLGYINLSLAVGSFYRSGSPQDGAIAATATYFTDLIKLRKTQMRQFIFFTYIKGLNREIGKAVSLDGKWKDGNDLPPLGAQRTTIGLETVYFMPWYFYGFQFALFYRGDINLLSNNLISFDKRAVFYTIRAGARMLNENLVLPTFAIELGYYGKNQNYPAAWEFKFSTTLPNLFGTSQAFKPEILKFN